MSLQDRFDRALDRIPGYDGYRDRERLRDTDRAVREELANDYRHLAERLQRLATTLATSRKLAAVQAVDQPLQRLQSFIDRLRTATYGYAPLFTGTTVDEPTLHQLMAFDRALADQLEPLSGQVAALEAADPEDEEFVRLASEVLEIINALHDRFDKRQTVIESGRKLPDRDVLALLEPRRPAETSATFRLHQGDALSYGDENYTVVGRISVELEREAIRAFQLRGGTGRDWLQVSSNPSENVFWLQQVELDEPTGSETATQGGTTYRLEDSRSGKGEIIGASGTAKDQLVRFLRYVSGSDARVLFVYDWGAGVLALRGLPVDPLRLELYTREV